MLLNTLMGPGAAVVRFAPEVAMPIGRANHDNSNRELEAWWWHSMNLAQQALREVAR